MSGNVFEAMLAIFLSACTVSYLLEGTIFFWNTKAWWVYPLGGLAGVMLVQVTLGL